MAHLQDYEIDRVKRSWTEPGTSTAGAELTVTHAAIAGDHHSVVKCDASYSDPTISGLLTIKFGSVTRGVKHVHGAGALDFGEFGLENPTANDAVSATLAGGGGAVVGTITLTGVTTGARQ